mgnify:CR=1 FL=1
MSVTESKAKATVKTSKKSVNPAESAALKAALEAAQVVDLGDQIVAFGEQDQGATVGDFAGSGEFIPMAETIEQRRAELFLQGPDCLAHAGLSQGHHLGRLGETTLAYHFDEDP